MDILDEAERLVSAAEAQGAHLRLFGGAAVAFLVQRPLVHRHAPRDLDFVCLSSDVVTVRDVIRAAGYDEDLGVARLFGTERRRFRHDSTGLVVDLCLDQFRFARAIDLRSRLHLRSLCVPVSDLLLSKLQPREVTTIDVIDAVNLLAAFKLAATESEDAYDAGRVASVCSRDWGLSRLVVGNLTIVERFAADDPRCDSRRLDLLGGIAALVQAVRLHPKTPAWHIRSAFGSRFRYWDEVSEEGYLEGTSP